MHEFPFLFPRMPERYQGREEVRAGYPAARGASPTRVERIHDVVVLRGADGQVLTVEKTVSRTVTTTGDSFGFPGRLVLRVRDGPITHVRDYMDGLRAAHTLGRLPAVVDSLAGDED